MGDKTNSNNKGKVWLVGAGPGDRGLMTLKGKDVLERAEVVVYDALVGSGILAMMPPEAEKIYVGKESKTIIAVHVQNGTETLFKLGDFNCLTVIAQSEEDAEAFFGTVMIKVEGEEWSPLELVGDLKEVK